MVLGKLESGSISKAQQLIMMPNRVRLHTHTLSMVKHYLFLCMEESKDKIHAFALTP